MPFKLPSAWCGLMGEWGAFGKLFDCSRVRIGRGGAAVRPERPDSGVEWMVWVGRETAGRHFN